MFKLILIPLASTLSLTNNQVNLQFKTPIGEGSYQVVYSEDCKTWRCLATGHVRVSSNVTVKMLNNEEKMFYFVNFIPTIYDKH